MRNPPLLQIDSKLTSTDLTLPILSEYVCKIILIMSLTITVYLQINSDEKQQGTYAMVVHGILFFVPQNLYIWHVFLPITSP
jgi:hypothetical protein